MTKIMERLRNVAYYYWSAPRLLRASYYPGGRRKPMFAPSINVDLQKLAQPEEKAAEPTKKVASKGVRAGARKPSAQKKGK